MKNKRRLKVVVTEKEIHLYGDPHSFKHKYIVAMINKKGGFMHHVDPGEYEFKLKRRGLALAVVLKPWH